MRTIIQRFVEPHARHAHLRFLSWATIAVIAILLTPFSSAYSGLAWAGAAQADDGVGTTVTYGPSGEIVASGHAATVMISNSTTYETLQMLTVDFFVQSIKFTSDEHFMIVGK